jgi:hypothetical protein
MFFAPNRNKCNYPFSMQNAKIRKTNAQTGGQMDKYDLIGLVIAILAVSIVLMH